MFIIGIILGIACIVINANKWFIIPDVVIYICFGISALLLVINIIRSAMFAKHYKETKNKFGRF